MVEAIQEQTNYDWPMFKRFISYYRNHMKIFVLDMLAASGLAVIELVYPAVTTRLIDPLENALLEVSEAAGGAPKS